MGGKSGTPPPPVSAPPDNSAMNMQMMQMMAMMMSNMPQAPTIPEAPEIIRDPLIDWEKQHEKLREEMSAEFQANQAAAHGAADTVHTSLLDDDNENTETISLATANASPR